MISTDAVLEIYMDDKSPENLERLVSQYGYLRTRAARKFCRPGLDRADLEQIAAIGLLKACRRYTSEAQTPFEAFAWLLVVGELMHFVRDHERAVRAPRGIRSLERKVHAAAEQLTADLRRTPSRSEIAHYAGVSARDVDDVHVYNERALAHSLDALEPHQVPWTQDHGSLEDAIVLRAALRRLTDVERRIILAMYGRGYNQGEIAQRLGYSRRHICRLHRSALQKLQADIVTES